MKRLLVVALLLGVPVFAQNVQKSDSKCLIASLVGMKLSPAFDLVIGNVAVEQADFDLVEAIGWKPDLKVFGPNDLRRMRSSGIRVFIVPPQLNTLSGDVKMAEAACRVHIP